MTTLGREVRRLREKRGMTLLELAADSHLGLTFIWAVEHDNDVDFTLWHVERLAKTLGVSEQGLLRLIPPERLRSSGPSSAA